MIIYYGDTQIEIIESDSSYRYRAIGNKNTLVLKWSSPTHQEIPVGAWTTYKNEVYTLYDAQDIKLKSGRNIEYSMTMYWAGENLSKYVVRNPIDNRIKFPYTAKPHEHLQLIVDNLNMRESGWTIGSYIDGTEVEIVYDGVKCDVALATIATTYKTEFDIATKSISLCRIELNKDNPLPLSYGKGNGFKPNAGRTNTDNVRPVEILDIQGGEDNINASEYGSTTLLLPKSQTLEYGGRSYITDEYGLSIRRSDKALSTCEENTLDCSDYYPKRVSTISGVETEVRTIDGEEVTFYDIIDDSIPDALDYSAVKIAGQTMNVKFQTGMLSGKSFDIESDDSGNLTGYVHSERKFKLCQQTYSTIAMPSDVYIPKIGDTYAVFNCYLPAAYVCDNNTQTGASWDMFRYAVKHLYENEDPRFTFTGELDGIYAKQNWALIEDKIDLGSYILFSDPRYQIEGVKIRIKGLKDFLHKSYSPILELSNITIGASIKSQIEKIPETEVVIKDRYDSAISYTDRRFRDVKETSDMLMDALLNFSGEINPIVVRTMQLVVGDESLQFQFVDDKATPTAVPHTIIYNAETKQLESQASIMQHMTLGIKALSSSHSASEYKFWDVEEYTSPVLADPTKRYYLYIKASKSAETAVMLLSETAIALEGVSGYYHFLTGVLNTEYDDNRSFVTLYGFTEILPGQMIIDLLRSASGQSFWDMLNNAFKLGDKLSFNIDGDGKLRIKGPIVQSESGDESPVGTFRGTYSSSYTYYDGDHVTYTSNGATSTYRYIYPTSSKGKTPTNTTYWTVTASAGANGDNGTNGGYYEYRYAVNGSTTTAPSITTSNTAPSGWSTSIPSVGYLQYLWWTMAQKDADGNLISTWSTPQRQTPKDGVNGSPGSDGDVGPVATGGNTYDSSKTYYGNSTRVDIVYYSGLYYIARSDNSRFPPYDGSFSGKTPTNTDYWNSFGAQFESVATFLLLADQARIGDWWHSGGKIMSSLDGDNAITLDAILAKITISSQSNGDYSMSSSGCKIELDAMAGCISCRSLSDTSKVATVSSSGIFANYADTDAVSAIAGCTHRGAVVGLGFANVNKSSSDIGANQTVVAGVYGGSSNSGTAPDFGGYFNKLYAAGVAYNQKVVTDSDGTVYLSDRETIVIGFNSGLEHSVYLPDCEVRGTMIFVKQWWTGSMRFRARSGQFIYDDASVNDYYDFNGGYGGIFTFTVVSINGVITEAWLVNQFKY